MRTVSSPRTNVCEPETEDDQPRSGQRRQRPDTGRELGEHGSGRGIGPADGGDVQAGDRRDPEPHRWQATARMAPKRPGRDEQEPGQRRPDERPEALRRARRDVRGDELARRARDGRQQRHVRGPTERSDAGLDRDHEEQELDREAQADDDGGRDDGYGADRVGRPEDDLWPPAHRRQAGERRDEGRRQEAGDPEEADGDGAADLIGGDQGRDEECPLARDDSEPGIVSARSARSSSVVRRAAIARSMLPRTRDTRGA